MRGVIIMGEDGRDFVPRVPTDAARLPHLAGCFLMSGNMSGNMGGKRGDDKGSADLEGRRAAGPGEANPSLPLGPRRQMQRKGGERSG